MIGPEIDSRVQTDVVKLGDTLSLIRNGGSASIGLGTVSVDQVGSSVNNRGGSLDSLGLHTGK